MVYIISLNKSIEPRTVACCRTPSRAQALKSDPGTCSFSINAFELHPGTIKMKNSALNPTGASLCYQSNKTQSGTWIWLLVLAELVTAEIIGGTDSAHKWED